jgi:chitinase
MRVVAYYAAWQAARLPPAAIDFSAFTELIHASALPNPDGTLDTNRNQLSDANSAAFVQAAHAAGKRVLVSIGGHASQAAFEGAMSDANRSAFVQNISALVQARGYDGVDLDMEPLTPADDGEYTKLVMALRGQPAIGLLTAATSGEPAMFAALGTALDAINLLSYNMSGPYPGWETWFDSPLYTAGNVFQSGKPLPSCDAMVQTFETAGVDPRSLNLGIHFYGAIWGGAYGPYQDVAGVTLARASYAQILDLYESSATYTWARGPEAPYLSVRTAAPSNDRFISYEDAALVAAKVAYVRDHGLGGVSVWELTGGHRISQPAGQQDALVDALKRAVPMP